jgi:hypothetical protein
MGDDNVSLNRTDWMLFEPELSTEMGFKSPSCSVVVPSGVGLCSPSCPEISVGYRGWFTSQ